MRNLDTLFNKPLWKFLLVGGLGTIINLAIFFVFSDILHLNHNLAAVIAFLVAVSNNYILNEKWSFAAERLSSLSFKRYAFYVFGNSISLILNILVLNILLLLRNWRLTTVPQFFGILIAMIVNYVWASKIVFRKIT